jgi:arylsulfatase A-like enzyme
MDGQDLAAVARGRAQPRQYVFGTVYGSSWPGPMARDYLGLTDGRWKYIWWPEGPQEQLFDLASDPQETTDLADRPEHAAERARMQKALVEWTAEHMPEGLEDGRLVQWDVKRESEADRRNRAWPGYHTEFYDVDVRH